MQVNLHLALVRDVPNRSGGLHTCVTRWTDRDMQTVVSCQISWRPYRCAALPRFHADVPNFCTFYRRHRQAGRSAFFFVGIAAPPARDDFPEIAVDVGRCRRAVFLSKAADAEGSLESTTTYGALRRCGVKSKDLGAGVPGLRRCAAGRPARAARPPQEGAGDPPPAPRPSAAEASRRDGRRIEASIPAASRMERNTTMIIGNFTYDQARDIYAGEIKTLTLQRSNVQFRSVTKTNPQEPDYRIVEEGAAGTVELGAAWKRTSKAGSEFLSVSLDDPALPKALSAALMSGQADTAILIWSRPAKGKQAN